MITRRLLLLAGLVSLLLAGCGGNGTDGTGTVETDEILVGSAMNGRILRMDATTGEYRGVFAQGGELVAPEGIAQLSNGNIAVGDFVTQKVLIYSPDGTLVQQIGPLAGKPYTLLALEDNNLLISEFDSAPTGRILRWAPNTGITTFAEGGELDGPDGLAIRDGILYVASQRSKEILRYNLGTRAFIDVWANEGFSGPTDAGPSGIVFGVGGDLIVTQHDNDQNVTKGGNVLRFNGLNGDLKGELIPGGRGGLSGPIGITLTTGNRYIVTSAATNNVLQFDATGNFLGTFFQGNAANGLDTPIYIAHRTVRSEP